MLLQHRVTTLRGRKFGRMVTILSIALICVYTVNRSFAKTWFEERTGINPSKPYPKISVHDINREIKKKFGIDPVTPFGKAGNNWLFKGWKPFREPLLPAERAADKAMSVVGESEKWAVLFLESMLWNRHWPDGFPKQQVKPLRNPSVEIIIQKSTINAATALYEGEIIPIAGSDHVEVGKVTVTLDGGRNVYVVNMSGGKLVYKFLRENSFHIKSATFEAVPVIKPSKGSTSLAIATRCVYLDVEDCPGEIDRFAARAITEALQSRNDGIIATVSLSDLLAHPVELKTASNKVGIPRLKEATVFVRGDAIVAQVAFDLVKQAKPSVKMSAPIAAKP